MVFKKKCRFFCTLNSGALLAVLAVSLFGCASAGVTTFEPYMGPQLPRPARILIYDFSSDFTDLPAASPLRTELRQVNTAQVQSQADLSRQLGAEISARLVNQTRALGLPGYRALKGTQTAPGDIVIKGYFLSLDQGSATERMALGFGTGAAELKVRVEGYQMTAQGLRYLAGGEGQADSGKTPGAALGLGVAIATANPVGLIVSSAAKAAGEASGSETIQGAADRISKLVMERLNAAYQRQGWI